MTSLPLRQSCRGVPRRTFLQIGGLALGGLSLPQILRAEAQSGITRSHKSVIMIFLSGGPPHQDMVDLKPDAPAEIRGEFKPIATNVPGIEICEHLPRLAAMMDRIAVIRSLVGSEGQHAAFQCMTGRTQQAQPGGGWPSLGSVVSKLQRSSRHRGAAVRRPVAADEDIDLGRRRPARLPRPGTRAVQAERRRPRQHGAQRHDPRPARRPQGAARQASTASAARPTRPARSTGADAHTQQALGILTSSKLADALDLEREDGRLRDRYGRGSPEPAGYGDAGPLLNDYFLAARRLVEAGVRVVTLAYGRWDWHGKPHGTTFENARHHLPLLDQRPDGPASRTCDQRGLDKDVSVVVWGEFGRTPQINKDGGRDHWPQVACALLAGGGMRTGQVIGSTNRLGRARQGPAGPLPGSLRHALSQPRHRPDTHDRHRPHAAARSTWSTAAWSRCGNWCETGRWDPQIHGAGTGVRPAGGFRKASPTLQIHGATHAFATCNCRCRNCTLRSTGNGTISEARCAAADRRARFRLHRRTDLDGSPRRAEGRQDDGHRPHRRRRAERALPGDRQAQLRPARDHRGDRPQTRQRPGRADRRRSCPKATSTRRPAT